MDPRISVVTSVYNGQSYLQECIESILGQSFEDFEYLILNNGSTDNTPRILERYNDPRLRIIHQESLGIAGSLNKGIRLSRGHLIARLDADDFSYPKRLETQLRFMDQNPDVVLCSSRFEELVGNRLESQSVPFVQTDAEIRRRISCFNPFLHSQMMFRRHAFLNAGGYDEALQVAQDYDLWVRLLKEGKGHNLDEILGVIRIHNASFSRENEGKLLKEVISIKWLAYRTLKGDLPLTVYYFLRNFASLILPEKVRKILFHFGR
jgi:glycosyltransferase involved in cell wall biosynthesis